MSVLARRYRITGIVQGVFFRASAKAEADSLGVQGWARNCDDGTVEVHAEGTEDQLSEFEAWLRRGPPAARVEHVESTESAPAQIAGFSVLS